MNKSYFNVPIQMNNLIYNISDIENELGVGEIIGNYIKLTGSNFLELFEFALDRPSYNLLLVQLERMASNFVRKMANRDEIKRRMNDIIDKGVVTIDVKTTEDLSFTSSVHQTKLNNMLKNTSTHVMSWPY